MLTGFIFTCGRGLPQARQVTNVKGKHLQKDPVPEFLKFLHLFMLLWFGCRFGWWFWSDGLLWPNEKSEGEDAQEEGLYRPSNSDNCLQLQLVALVHNHHRLYDVQGQKTQQSDKTKKRFWSHISVYGRVVTNWTEGISDVQ